MARIRKRQSVRVNTRFYVVLAILIIGAAVIGVLALTNKAGGELVTGEIKLDLSVKGVVIRSETSVEVDKFDKATYKIKEGEKVYEGMPVATVYKWGYSDDMMQSLISLQSQIYDMQCSLFAGIENSDVKLIEDQITQKRLVMRETLLSGGEKDMLELQNELLALLEQRENLLATVVQPTEELSALYASAQTKKTQIAEWRNEIVCPGAGVASFYFDGFEQALNADKLDILTADLVNSAKKAQAPSSVASSLLYRIVDPNKWYVAFTTKASDPLRTAAGESYSVSFGGYTAAPLKGTALAPIVSDDYVVNILAFTDDIGELMSIRSVEITLDADMTGIKVPLKAISIKNGVPGITLELTAGERFIEVDVLASDKENAIVRGRNAGETLTSGLRYKTP